MRTPGIGGRWTAVATRAATWAAARVARARAVRALPRALPDVTDRELRLAGDSVEAGVRAMPDLLRTGFAATLLLALPPRDPRLFAVAETERFGRGLALAAVFEARAGEAG